MDTLRKKLGRRLGREQTPKDGTILFADGQTVCRNVTCTAGTLVKDIINQVCTQEGLQIVPMARPFFALCDPKTGIPLSPYHELTAEEANKKYQFRVFVNTTENSSHFLKMSKSAYGYYYRQLKEEFVGDRLYPRTCINTGIWMSAIDLAREAHDKNLDYTDLIHGPKDLLRVMPKYLREKCLKEEPVRKKLQEIFQRFKDIRGNVGVEHYEAKYVEVFEKDGMCGKHIFRLKTEDPNIRRHQAMLVVVSCKDGVYKVKTGESNTPATKIPVCSISCLVTITVDVNSVTLLARSSEDSPDQDPVKMQLNFFDKRESQSFAVILHTYFQLLVNANEVILSGILAPQDNFFRVGCNSKDSKKLDLCHAPIPPQFVQDILSKNGMMTDGNFLIRESRNSDSAYTLSICYQQKIMNYRIVNLKEGGYSFQDPQSLALGGSGTEGNQEPKPSHRVFPTLAALIEHHRKSLDGLPAPLKFNYSPAETGPIPLLKRILDPAVSSSNPSPDTSAGPTPDPTPDPTPVSLTPDPTPSPDPWPLLHSDPYIREMIAKGVRHIDYSKLKSQRELGSGHYSTVYLASWIDENRQVAMKIPTMKEHNVENVKKDLMREILTMSALRHPNIVELLGISDTKHYLDYIGIIPVVVMEFIDRGCLRTYLNNCKKTPGLNTVDIKRNFVLYGRQIAEGMSYLAQSKIVHRDLAARNVLLVSNEQVKISDFGLARQQKEDTDYYKAKNNDTDLPIYWYSPECLESFKFSTKGDVWSYGVTLWEMFTMGDNPSAHLGHAVRTAQTAQMAFKAIVSLYRIQKYKLPSMTCDKTIYNQIILQCWELDVSRRPTFDQLGKLMGDLYDRIKTAAVPTTAAAPTTTPNATPTLPPAATSGSTHSASRPTTPNTRAGGGGGSAPPTSATTTAIATTNLSPSPLPNSQPPPSSNTSFNKTTPTTTLNSDPGIHSVTSPPVGSGSNGTSGHHSGPLIPTLLTPRPMTLATPHAAAAIPQLNPVPPAQALMTR